MKNLDKLWEKILKESIEKDRMLDEIKNEVFEYKPNIHAIIIKEFSDNGYIDVTDTKDGPYIDITDIGLSFINTGGYLAKSKKKAFKMGITFAGKLLPSK